MRIIDGDQGGAEWFQARAGRITATGVSPALSFLKRGDKKGEESKGRADLKLQLAMERICGKPMLSGFLSPYMQQGTALEPFARAKYEIDQDVEVQQVCFVIHPTIEMSGASPDGLVAPNGGLEIKAPKETTHFAYLEAGILPPEYADQVMWNIACCERDWWDFVSYCEWPDDDWLRMFRIRVPRDDKRIAEMEAGVRQFDDEVNELRERILRRRPELTQAERVFGKDYKSNPELLITEDDVAWAMRGFTQ